jgi:hypothetical protein
MSTSTWNDIRRLADEIELKVHLGRMDARDRWRELRPRLVELEQTLEVEGKRANDKIEKELATMGTQLRRLRDDIFER